MFCVDQCTSVKLLWKMLKEGSSTQEVQKLISQSRQSETLRSLSTGYPKEIPVGLVELTLSIAEECSKKGPQYILSFDGKMVARGLKGECFGDIDLWGVEKPISMKCSLQLLERNIRACENLNSEVNENKLFCPSISP